MEEVLRDRAMTIEEMEYRHPWVPVFWNKLYKALKVALVLSFIWWGIMTYLGDRDSAAGEAAVKAYIEDQVAAAAQPAEEPEEDPNDIQIRSVLPVIARLSTDQQKRTELGIFIARCMNSEEFPGTLKENAEKPGQWPLFDGSDTTWDDHDLELAEEILRPYLVSGKIPVGLTKDMCWGTWSPNDLVARNEYDPSPTMETWRWQG